VSQLDTPTIGNGERQLVGHGSTITTCNCGWATRPTKVALQVATATMGYEQFVRNDCRVSIVNFSVVGDRQLA